MNSKLIFEPDLSVDQTNFYFFEKGFCKADLNKIDKIAKKYPDEKATFVSGDSENIRKSTIKWLHPDENTEWIYDCLMTYVNEANNTLWKFDLHSIIDSIQYTVYNGGGGHYDWHMDIGPDSIAHRKVSIVVQLSDEKDYTGGDFQIHTGRGIQALSKEKGMVAIFPSYLLHRVTPVLSGTRKSLVLWAGGGHYK